MNICYKNRKPMGIKYLIHVSIVKINILYLLHLDLHKNEIYKYTHPLREMPLLEEQTLSYFKKLTIRLAT